MTRDLRCTSLAALRILLNLKKCALGLVKPRFGMYKRAKFPISRHPTFGLWFWPVPLFRR